VTGCCRKVRARRGGSKRGAGITVLAALLPCTSAPAAGPNLTLLWKNKKKRENKKDAPAPSSPSASAAAVPLSRPSSVSLRERRQGEPHGFLTTCALKKRHRGFGVRGGTANRGAPAFTGCREPLHKRRTRPAPQPPLRPSPPVGARLPAQRPRGGAARRGRVRACAVTRREAPRYMSWGRR